MKIREVLKNGIIKLNKYEIDEPILKARSLLEYELNVSSEYVAVHIEDEIDSEIIEMFERHIEEMVKGKPLQYITNSQWFYGFNFYVDENVLIPQPDTEILVEEVVDIAKNMSRDLKILDICTGSGAIAVAISRNIDAEITASDISKNALEIAKKNALNNETKINFVESDMFENINGKFDIIVSNPPYIETETIEKLSEEVKNEPMLALDGGGDGLKFYRILAEQSKKYLVSDGILAVEIGYNQREEVMNIFEKSGFVEVYSKKDFGENDRIVVGKWR